MLEKGLIVTSKGYLNSARLPHGVVLLLLLVSTMWGMNDEIKEPSDLEEQLSLEKLIAEAVEKNPQINSLRELEEAKRAIVPQVYSLPDPLISYSVRNVGLERITVGEEMMAGRLLSFTQKIPFPGKLGHRKNTAKWAAAASSHITTERSLAVISSVKTAYYDLYYIYEAIDIVDEIQGFLQTFLKTAEVRYKVGKGIQQDVLKIQVELSRLNERKILLEERKVLLKNQITKLLGREPGSLLGRPTDIELNPMRFTLTELNTIAYENSPTLQFQNALAAREESNLSLAKRQYYPDIYLGMTWMERGSIEDIWEARVGLEIPLYFWTKERKGIEEAKSRYSMAKYDVEDVRLQILQMIQDLSVELDTSEKLYDLFVKTIIPQANLTLQSSRRGYETGEVDFLTMLENLIVLLNYQLEAELQLVRHENSLAELASIIGKEL